MILVQNHLQRLSGNRFWCLLFICFCVAACSPKTRTNKSPKKEIGNKEDKKDAASEKKFTEANISLLIPLNLNSARIKAGSKAELDKSAMAIDFYQGFKMGIDSAAAAGMNFKVKVLDTRDNNVQITSLLKSGQLAGTNLIIGPVFPDGVKFITNYSIVNNIPVVSPLAATHPDEFNNPNLISIVNNIDLHADKMGDYIRREYDPGKAIVVLINPKKSGDEVLGNPLRDYFQKGRGSRYIFQEYASVFAMETKMVPGKQYAVLISSADRAFVVGSIDKLAKMKTAGSNIELFGHPNWGKQNYNIEKLQLLRTKITTSYFVDYKSRDVINFVRKYRQLNKFEPAEYSFKGFDIGFFFGKLFAEHGAGYLKHLTQEHYDGLENSFRFIKDDKLGYINTSLFLLEYKNFALTPIE
ncbi:type 1 periplasmic-binding domain-containing protein [Pedobacter cryoconitis]|uniref:ABC-type branched-subunit amino acid transport system substrate-binding protein n=1 Tax=Pedobacter cryoconitis TaxID=188932 RepID=A0A327S113_9SPHI|nr:amino acid ABC transporter substrate-binding protein [Pedobacter cryoconitis]RAJ22679.1 ABC-type branched-subunit amino acid transport system substrate-binding protein [Pedobacter cryoconitis]